VLAAEKQRLALQYLVNGVKLGEPGVYVTFEEMPNQIYRDAKNPGWDLGVTADGRRVYRGYRVGSSLLID